MHGVLVHVGVRCALGHRNVAVHVHCSHPRNWLVVRLLLDTVLHAVAGRADLALHDSLQGVASRSVTGRVAMHKLPHARTVTVMSFSTVVGTVRISSV